MKRNNLISVLLVFLVLLALCAGCQNQTPAPLGGVPEVTEAASTESTIPTNASVLTAEASAEASTVETESVSDTTEEVPVSLEEAPETTAPNEAATEAVSQNANEQTRAEETASAAPTACQHTYGTEKLVAPTCTKGGYSEHTCTRCGYTETFKRTASTGHLWGAGVIVKPTCTEKGYTLYTCTRCGSQDKHGWTDKLGHTWNTWTQSKAPTCSTAGEESRSCSVCGKSETREITKLPHNYKAETVAPSCTEGGYTVKTCTVCGATEQTDRISALGHDYKFTQTVAPTTSAGGYDLYTCTRCGATEQRNKTDKLPEVIDLQTVIEYGLAYAQSLGYTVDRTMTPQNSSYYPGYLSNMTYFPNEITMDFLKSRVIGIIDGTTAELIAGGDTIPGFRCNIYASYDKDYCGEYYIIFLYG